MVDNVNPERPFTETEIRLSNLDPSKMTAVQLAGRNLASENFPRSLPLLPYLSRDGKTLSGTVYVIFDNTLGSEIDKMGGQKYAEQHLLGSLSYINQTSSDGYRINLTFKRMTDNQRFAYNLGLFKAPVLLTHFVKYEGNDSGTLGEGGNGELFVTPNSALRTIIHELGHNLGFYHSWKSTDVMFSYGAKSGPRSNIYRLPDWQIRKIVLAYPQRPPPLEYPEQYAVPPL